MDKIDENGPGTPPVAPEAVDPAAEPSGGPGGGKPPWTSGRLAFRCTLPYAEWSHGLAAWARIPTAEVIDQAVRRYADSLGYPPEQPPRLPSNRSFLPTYQLRAAYRRNGGVS